MKDSVIESRLNKEGRGTVDYVSLVEARESHQLSLRKQRMTAMVLQKRKNQTMKNKYKPYINLTEIPKHLQEEGNLQYFLDQLQNYPPGSMTFFHILQQINNRVTKLTTENYLEEITQSHIFETLHRILLNWNKNKTIIYLIVTIFISLSQADDPDITEKFLTITNLQIYFELLNNLNSSKKDNEDLLSEMILFFGNLVPNNTYIQTIFYKYEVFDTISFILNDELETGLQNKHLIKECISFYVRFSSLETFPSEDCADVLYRSFTYFLCSNEIPDMIPDCITGLYFVSFCKYESIFHHFIEDNIIHTLIDICTMKQDFIKPTIRVIGNIASLTDQICKEVFNQKICFFLVNSLLYNTSSQVKIETLWALNNLCLGTEMECLFEYNLLEDIIRSLDNQTNFKVETETMKLLALCVVNNKTGKKIINEKLVDHIVSFINRDTTNDNDMVSIVLVLLESLLNEGESGLVFKIKNSCAKEKLEHWSLSENEEIKSLSTNLLEIYF